MLILFVAPLANVTSAHAIRHHQYADDSQVYITAAKHEIAAGVDVLEICTNDIYSWLTNNSLALNPSKSEAINFHEPAEH